MTALNDRSKREKRNFTAEEQREWDLLEIQHDRMDEKVKAEERQELKRQAELVEPDISAVGGDGRPIQHRVKDESSRLVFRDDSTGKTHRGILPGEDIAAALNEGQPGYPDGIEDREVSLGRWIKAKFTRDWRGAEAEQRAFTGSEDDVGGYALTGAISSKVIAFAANLLSVRRAGAQIIAMDTPTLKIPKATELPDVSFKAERAAGSYDDSARLGVLNLTAHTCFGVLSASREIMMDSPDLFGNMVERMLGQSLALEWDRGLLRGNGGSDLITGLKFTDDIQVNALTNSLEMDNILTSITQIWQENGPESDRLGLILSAREFGRVQQFKTGDGAYLTSGNSPIDYSNLGKFRSNQIQDTLGSGTDSEGFLGAFRDAYVIGVLRDITIEIAQGSDDVRDFLISIAGWLRTDGGSTYPVWFSHLTGLEA